MPMKTNRRTEQQSDPCGQTRSSCIAYRSRSTVCWYLIKLHFPLCGPGTHSLRILQAHSASLSHTAGGGGVCPERFEEDREISPRRELSDDHGTDKDHTGGSEGREEDQRGCGHPHGQSVDRGRLATYSHDFRSFDAHALGRLSRELRTCRAVCKDKKMCRSLREKEQQKKHRLLGNFHPLPLATPTCSTNLPHTTARSPRIQTPHVRRQIWTHAGRHMCLGISTHVCLYTAICAPVFFLAHGRGDFGSLLRSEVCTAD